MNDCQKPCAECPFARHVRRGGTGGKDPAVYVGQALGPFLLSCHMTPGYDRDQLDPDNPQCAGAAIYRANIDAAHRLPAQVHRLPADRTSVFATPAELIAHHRGITIGEAEAWLRKYPPFFLLRVELNDPGVRPA